MISRPAAAHTSGRSCFWLRVEKTLAFCEKQWDNGYKQNAKEGYTMLFKPAQLGLARLDAHELEEDKKACRKIGPCGVGKKALYLNSFYIDRRYYLPYGSITRVFKRVAMSQGGFSGKGMFASMAYLVVEYDGGKQKQCNFKDERDVDALLEVLAKEQPNIPRLSAAGEAELARQKAEKAARRLPRSRKRPSRAWASSGVRRTTSPRSRSWPRN